MWNNLDKPWQISFQQAWESYCNGSIPIGAVLLDKNNNIVSIGRNRVNETTAPTGHLSHNKLAHAELNTLLQLNTYTEMKDTPYTIYVTLEPCPLCFGAIMMSKASERK